MTTTTVEMTTTVEPGFAKLPLDVNTEHFDTDDVAKYRYKVLENYLQEKIDRPERHAVRNLLGFIDARLKRYEKAIEILSKVLEEDQDNVNALANLQWVYKTRGSDNDSRQDEIAERLDDLRPMLDIVDSPRAKVIKARYLTEQGYAICNGITRRTHDAHANASAMYDEALELAENLVSIEEKTDWRLGSARAKDKILHMKVKSNDFASTDVDLEKQLIEHFEVVLKNGDDNMKAEVWVKLGTLFRYFATMSKYERNASDAAKPADTNPPECIKGKCEFLACYLQPLTCYDKALEFRPKHAQILRQKAQMMKQMIFVDIKSTTLNNEDALSGYKSALSLLDESIEADSSLMNHYAFSLRGDIYLNMYVNIFQKGRDAKSHLNKAIDGYEISTKMHAVPEDYRQLGEIWRLMADHSVGTKRKECLEKALEYYTRATQMDESLGFVNVFTQWKRGECCLVLGNYTEAGECYKLAISNSMTNEEYLVRNYSRLFYTYLLRLHDDNQQANEALVKEATDWLQKAIGKFGEVVAAEKCIKFNIKYRDKDILRRLHMFIDICQDEGEVELALFCRKAYPYVY
ncbi:tetratricopeptide repeat protein 22-like [Amphiura filiformis]|uniref:tetratricopeptide repeat protein 22-like n=1 Tax=Amphiura filiformis TaxID=82378 RepID=UPI003B220F97